MKLLVPLTGIIILTMSCSKKDDFSSVSAKNNCLVKQITMRVKDYNEYMVTKLDYDSKDRLVNITDYSGLSGIIESINTYRYLKDTIIEEVLLVSDNTLRRRSTIVLNSNGYADRTYQIEYPNDTNYIRRDTTFYYYDANGYLIKTLKHTWDGYIRKNEYRILNGNRIAHISAGTCEGLIKDVVYEYYTDKPLLKGNSDGLSLNQSPLPVFGKPNSHIHKKKYIPPCEEPNPFIYTLDTQGRIVSFKYKESDVKEYEVTFDYECD